MLNKLVTTSRNMRKNFQKIPGISEHIPSVDEVNQARILVFRDVSYKNMQPLVKENKYPTAFQNVSVSLALKSNTSGRLAGSYYSLDFKLASTITRHSEVTVSLIRETHVNCLLRGWRPTLCILPQWIPNGNRINLSVLWKQSL